MLAVSRTGRSSKTKAAEVPKKDAVPEIAFYHQTLQQRVLCNDTIINRPKVDHHVLCIFSFFLQSTNRGGSPAPALLEGRDSFVQNFRRSSSRRHHFSSSEVSQHHPLSIPPFERKIRTYQTQTARGYDDPTDAGDFPQDSGGYGYGIYEVVAWVPGKRFCPAYGSLTLTTGPGVCSILLP
jgi:hypothetical protein